MTIKYANIINTNNSALDNRAYRDRQAQIICEAEQARHAMLRALRDSQDPRLRSLEKQLDACCRYSILPKMRKSYNLPLCSVCIERTRRTLITAVTSLLHRLFRDGELSITWVEVDLPDQRYRRGDLYRLDLSSLNRQIQQQYAKVGFPLTFSSVNISFIQKFRMKNKRFGDNCNEGEPFWQARVCSVIIGLPRRDVISAIRNLYPRQSFEKRRHLDAEEGLRSTIKTGFFEEWINKDNNSSIITPMYGLLDAELRELAYCFGGYNMSVLYPLTGCRLTDGDVELNKGIEKRLKQLAAA
jgi:hypothetical protein